MPTTPESNIITPLSEPERHFLHRLRERTRAVAEEIVEEAVGDIQPEDTMADLEERNMTYYAKPSLDGYESSVAKPAIAANNFEIKSSIIHLVETSAQFNGLPEEDPNAHIARFLRLCVTFKIHNCSDDAVRLRLFPFSLRSRAMEWLDALPPGTITTWAKMAVQFLWKYFPPDKTAKLRSSITGFRQDDDKSLHAAWERYKSLLRRCPHHGLDLWLQCQMFYDAISGAHKQAIDQCVAGDFGGATPTEAFQALEKAATKSFAYNPLRARPTQKGIHHVDSDTLVAAQLEALTKKFEQMQTELKKAQLRCDTCGKQHKTSECQQAMIMEEVDYVGGQNNSYGNNYNCNWKNNSNFREGGNNQQPPGINRRPAFQQQNAPFSPKQPYQGLSSSNQPTEEPSVESLLQQHLASTQSSNKMIDQQNQRNEERFQKHEVEMKRRCRKKYLTRIREITTPAIEKQNKEPVQAYVPSLPYTGRLKKEKLEKEYGKFLGLFKQLHVNLPFIKALTQMPNYAKFLKGVLTKKRKLEELSHVILNEECSAVLQNKLPIKMTDPGSFAVPCLIGDLSVSNALADLGASINLMPYAVFEKLKLGEPKPTRMSIQLADRSVKYPRGQKRSPHLWTTLLGYSQSPNRHVHKLTLRVNNEEITFDIGQSMKHPQHHDDSLYFIDFCDSIVSCHLRESREEEACNTQLIEETFLDNSCMEEEVLNIESQENSGPSCEVIDRDSEPKA
ncbi:hypothetical protein L1987_60546 [Smallanthus sonchifolius]|uniref:Uncharacterized protein n=1 Tax=Smallanthus sonchifolius TaxID=185202 RepID=A0ACB9D8R4_9ASTR|nr:hypothetical protein L1987_60546 [Smallanthus sonchifolius]